MTRPGPRRMIRRLEEFISGARHLDPKGFAHEYGEAFLLHHGPIGKLQPPMETTATMAVEGAGTTPDIPFNPRRDFVVFVVQRLHPATADDDVIWVGRSEDNDVVVPDASVSAVHAFIKQEQGNFLLQDMSSMNGSYINDQPVVPQGMGPAERLDSGARVRLGTVNLTFLEAPEFRNLVNRLAT